MRERKPETVIRGLKRQLKKAKADARECHDEAYRQRGRATRAEQEVAEWKRRFDLLLERTPKEMVKP